MYSRRLAGLSLSAALVLTACTPDQSSVTPLPTEASFSRSASTSCSFTATRSDAKAYFVSSHDPVFALIDAMQTAHKRGGNAGATNAGFAVLARIGAAADAGSTQVKGSPAKGSELANDVLSCMSVAGYHGAVDFAGALGATGLFGVRGGQHQEAVTSRGLDERGLRLFGAEKTGATWHPTVSSILFYGFERPTPQFTAESPAGAGFELNSLPAGLTFAPPIRAGVCTFSTAGARILHEHQSVDVILPPAGLPSFCGSSSASVAPLTPMQRVASWLSPKPLYAALVAGGGGGLLSGLSPLGPVTFSTVLAFTTQPSSAIAGATFNPVIQVRALSALGTPLQGVPITLSVVGAASTSHPTHGTAVTLHDGTASFPDFTVAHPGTFTITATAGELGASVPSAPFHVH